MINWWIEQGHVTPNGGKENKQGTQPQHLAPCELSEALKQLLGMGSNINEYVHVINVNINVNMSLLHAFNNVSITVEIS